MFSLSPDLAEYLDEQTALFNTTSFIAEDPISIPHLFTKKEDIEISAFLTATIAWGQRAVILKNSRKMLELMDMAPYEFILNHSPHTLKIFRNFVHRTFNNSDLVYFIEALQKLYRNHNGLEGSFNKSYAASDDLGTAIHKWRNDFFSFRDPGRTAKHFSDPLQNSSAKRLCMFLRWMVRRDKSGVDFGLWKSIPPSALCAPLDLHSGRVARLMGLLSRNQNDWKAVIELTSNLRMLDANDPVKYDFALFGLGVTGNL